MIDREGRDDGEEGKDYRWRGGVRIDKEEIGEEWRVREVRR